MKIAYKLAVAVGLPIALTWVVVLYATTSSENSLSDAIEGASASRAHTIMEAIDRVMHSRITDWMAYGQSPEVQKTLGISNRQFAQMDDVQRHIDEIDLAWRTTPPESPSPLMEALSGNNLAKAMRARIETLQEANGFPIFGEVFITNRYGVNIAQTGRTSDYRQDDEDWWKLAKRDGLYVADVGFDESAGVFSTDVCLRIDDEHGVFLGVLKAVLNIKEAVDIVKAQVDDNGNASLCDYLLFNSKRQIIHSSDPTMKFLTDGSPYFNGVVPPSHDRVFTTYRRAEAGSHPAHLHVQAVVGLAVAQDVSARALAERVRHQGPTVELALRSEHGLVHGREHLGLCRVDPRIAFVPVPPLLDTIGGVGDQRNVAVVVVGEDVAAAARGPFAVEHSLPVHPAGVLPVTDTAPAPTVNT